MVVVEGSEVDQEGDLGVILVVATFRFPQWQFENTRRQFVRRKIIVEDAIKIFALSSSSSLTLCNYSVLVQLRIIWYHSVKCINTCKPLLRVNVFIVLNTIDKYLYTFVYTWHIIIFDFSSFVYVYAIRSFSTSIQPYRNIS